MASKSVTTVGEREAQLALQVARLQEELHGISGVFSWLGALFGQLKDNPIRAMELTEMGQYIADDWADTVDQIKSKSEQAVAEITAAEAARAKAAA